MTLLSRFAQVFSHLPKLSRCDATFWVSSSILAFTKAEQNASMFLIAVNMHASSRVNTELFNFTMRQQIALRLAVCLQLGADDHHATS
jgi:hypothetical protein